MRNTLGRWAVHGSRYLVALGLVVGIPFGARGAGNEEIRNHLVLIERLYDNLEYELALKRIQLALQVPRGTEDEVTLALYKGILLCELGKLESATSAFKFALLLRPDAKLPKEVAPKIEQLFESAREQVKREVASLRPQRDEQNPVGKTGSVREPTPTSLATVPSAQPEPSPGASAPTNATSGQQLSPTAAKPEAKGPGQSPNKEEPASPRRVTSQQENHVDLGQTDMSGCQVAVRTECAQLLKRLFLLQDAFLRTDSFFKRGPLEELAGIAQQLRAAQTSEALRKAANGLESWRHQYLSHRQQ